MAKSLDFFIGTVLASNYRCGAICLLGENEYMRAVDLTSKLAITTPHAAQIFNQLIKHGLMKNVNNNKTWKVFSLTPLGQKVYKAIRKQLKNAPLNKQ